MSAKLYALGRWCFRNGGRVLSIWLVLALVIGLGGFLLRGSFNDAFEIPGSSSQEALERLSMTFPQGSATSAKAVVVAPEGVDINDLRPEIEASLEDFEALDLVDEAQSPWFEYISGQVSDDDRVALINLTLHGEEMPSLEDLQPIVDTGEDIEEALPDGSEVVMGGQAFEIELPSVSVTEVFGVIVSFAVLWVMLSSVLAAALPVITALLGVGLTMALMLGATSIIDINSVTPMLAVMLGIAVGIDYALFIFSRHRDQLRDGMACEESMARSIGTAGTAIVFAGLTNAIALMGLAVAGITFLTVMGVFASIAVVFAVAIALTLLPAFAGMLGERMRPKGSPKPGDRESAETREADAKEAPARRPAEEKSAHADEKPRKKSLFRWWVSVTTSHPVITIVAVVVSLGILSIPAAGLTLSLPNAGQQTTDRSARVAYDLTAEHFGPGYNAPLVVTANIIDSTDPLGLVEELRDEVESVEGIDQVVLAAPNENADTALIQIVPDTASDDPATVETVERLRDVTDGWAESRGIDADVTGFTAVQLDVTQRLGAAVWPFGILVVTLSLVLLAAVFRSVWVPIKTAVGFLLSIGAAFGATTLVFNEGWFKEIVNLEQPVAVISFLPILLMGILFGLAMDYEIFIVSRIREEYMHGRGAVDAIRRGFAASGPVVTAAALIMFAVFAFFVPAGMLAIKAIAFALAVGVLVDAFLIRMTLVPAVLALLGDHAWWMPKWLDKALPVFDMEGEVLTKQLELADWPGTDAVLYAEDVEVEGLVEPFSLQVRVGEVAGIVGPVGARGAALLALGGRLETSGGRGRISGALLPESSSAIRRRSLVVDVARAGAGVAELERLSPKEGSVVFVDGLDAVGSAAERETLQRFVERARAEATFAVVCGATSAGALTVITPEETIHVQEPAHEGSLV